MHELNLSLHHKQGQALTTPAQELLYGGAAGGGKSFLMRASPIWWSTQIPGLQTYIFRRIHGDLVKNHMEGPGGFPVLLAPMVQAGRCVIVGKEIRFANGSKIFLSYCQHEKDVYRFQGAEIHFLEIDEITHWTETMYRYLRGRCRMGGLKLPEHLKALFPRILLSGNPGGLGHHWVKQTFVDYGPMKIHRTEKKEGGMLRQFIPAVIEDNPTLLENDPDYVDRLEGLGDPILVRAMKEGDWDVVAGAMFGYVWRRSRHTCEPFAIPEGWEIWRGGDDGFAAPASCHWLTQDPDRGTIYVIAEIYKEGLQPDDYAAQTLRMDRGIRRIDGYGQTSTNGQPLAGLMDSGAFVDPAAGQNVPSRGSQMNAKGTKWTPVQKGPGSRVQRCHNMHRVLARNPRDPAGGPGLVFFNTCLNAIRTIPALGRDPHNIEDVDTSQEDHAYDSVTYGLQWRLGKVSRVNIRGF